MLSLEQQTLKVTAAEVALKAATAMVIAEAWNSAGSMQACRVGGASEMGAISHGFDFEGCT